MNLIKSLFVQCHFVGIQELFLVFVNMTFMLVIFMHPVVIAVMSFVIEVSLVAECSLEGRAGIGVKDDISVGKRLK